MGALDDLPIAATRHGTLVANVVTSVDLGVDCVGVRILCRSKTGADDLYALVDPGVTNPAVAGNDTKVVPVGQWATFRAPAVGNTVVKLISPGTPNWTVEGFSS